MAKKRTDLHRPSAIVPADYTFVGCDYHGISTVEEGYFAAERNAFQRWRERTGAKFAVIERDRGGCDICGAYCSYIARFHHVPTNTVITTGWDCAEKMGIDDPNAFKSFRKKARAGIEAMAGKRKAQRILAERNLSPAWDLFVADPMTLPRSTRRYEQDQMAYEELTIRGIVHKVVHWGSISDAQAQFVADLLARIPERNARNIQRAEQRAAEAAAAKPVPLTADRVEIQGTILMVRTDDTDFGPVEKCLVQHADGWKVWGSCPIGGKGDVIAFKARIQRSDKDEKFGFFSRPTKPRIVKAGPATQAEMAPPAVQSVA